MSANGDTDLEVLNRHLDFCSESIKSGDFGKMEKAVAELVKFLDSTSSVLINEEQECPNSEVGSFEILIQIHEYLGSPSLEQEFTDIMAFELPKAVAKFAWVSERCMKVVENILDLFIHRCSANEMLSILSEAISVAGLPDTVPGYFIPLLGGLAKVFILIKRRHYENMKSTIHPVINVLSVLRFNSDIADNVYESIVLSAFQIAHSMRSASAKLEGEVKRKLQALLGLYVLQITVDMSVGLPKVSEYTDFLQFCELSYIGLITGRDVDLMYNLVVNDDSDDCSNCFSDVKLGAAIAVIWGYKASKEVSATKVDFTGVIEELQGNWTTRWEAISVLKYIFSCPGLSLELKKQGMRFLLCIMDGDQPHLDDHHVDADVDISIPYSTLNAIEKVIMSSEPELRKQAFIAFKKLLGDIPTSMRFDVLKALLMNSGVSSMIAIHLDCVKEDMHKSRIKGESLDQILPTFWKPSVLQFVELVLRPPSGGPPSLPEYSDAVLSALNLFRFILITESTGNSNFTGILSREALEKAYNDWLLPLRALVTGMVAQHQSNLDELSSIVVCAFNPVELVLYRCIELVEEKLKELQQQNLK